MGNIDFLKKRDLRAKGMVDKWLAKKIHRILQLQFLWKFILFYQLFSGWFFRSRVQSVFRFSLINCPGFSVIGLHPLLRWAAHS
jgi:hypothetical protein